MASRIMPVFAALLLLALAAGCHAQAPPTDPSLCNPRIPGALHLSCYAANRTVASVLAAKLQCFRELVRGNASYASCEFTVVANGTQRYGCGTYITYVANTAECLSAYQGQEKTNPNCTNYIIAHLGDAMYRNTANVTAPANCTATGPCAQNKTGPYHFSCYTRTLNTTGAGGVPGNLGRTVANAKAQCANSFVSSRNATAANCTLSAFGGVWGLDTYNCDVYIAYTFGTRACLDLYQAQEKTNPNCTYYNAAGLGAAPNRDTPTPFLNTSYSCPY